MTSSEAVVLRVDVLQSLCSMLGSHKATGFIASFRSELSHKLNEIERNRTAPAIVASASHKLVGIAGALGLEELSFACQTLSANAKRGQVGLGPLIDGVQAAALRAMAALDLGVQDKG